VAKKKTDTNEVLENVSEEVTEETQSNEINYEELLAKKDEEINAVKDQYQRLLAEYDNFKKRTQKEKEAIYTDSVKDTVAELLPVIDNLIRAVDSFSDKESEECKGVSMVLKQTEEIFTKLGVTEIKAVGEQFNPELHNAVMHIEDETIDDNTVVEEFQKGYLYKDKVIRYSMVKVAN
jgi:molecular chaperone GrpE